MKKVSSILIFLATLAIFGISTESFAKNQTVFSAQANQPSAYSTIEEYRAEYDALGGNADSWTGNPPSSLEEARILVENLWTWIGKFRAYFGSGDQTWTGIAWTGTYKNPKTTEIENTPTYTEASELYKQVIREIARLKRDYLDLGGSEEEWTGTNQGIGGHDANEPTLSEAQTLHGELVAEIARLKTEYLTLGGTEDKWTGSYDNPDTPAGVNTPTLSEALALIAQFEIARLKTDYLALGGEANDWTGSYEDPDTPDDESTPTLSEAQKLHNELVAKSKPQALVELLKNSESSKILIIGLTAGISGALVLGGGLGYWFYRRRQKS